MDQKAMQSKQWGVKPLLWEKMPRSAGLDVGGSSHTDLIRSQTYDSDNSDELWNIAQDTRQSIPS